MPGGEVYEIAGMLETDLLVVFSEKISHADSYYWDFRYNSGHLTLHYNTFGGLSIFPVSMTAATEDDRSAVADIFEALSSRY